MQLTKSQARLLAQFLSTDINPSNPNRLDWYIVTQFAIDNKLAIEVTSYQSPDNIIELHIGWLGKVEYKQAYKYYRPRWWTINKVLVILSIVSAVASIVSAVASLNRVN